MHARSPEVTMTGEPPQPLVTEDEPVHGTFGCERTVLVIARTITSTARLLDALRFFRDDFRVDLVFTVNDTSRHSTGVHELLRDARADRIVPWDQVRKVPYALAISASENIDFDELDLSRPVVVLPHGIGFNKYVPDPKTGGTRLAGLPSEYALRTGNVLVTLANEAQDRQLRAVRPEVAGSTAVVGDPTFDQLRASLPLRDRYRRALGLRGRKLVLLSSTWREEGLLGTHRGLAERLLAQLPADEYAVALAMHPNIWSWYGELRVRTWFADAVDAGLLLLPPDGGWQAALVAAHQVVGDHGSVSLYAACLGKPLLLAAFGAESVPGTPIEVLQRGADHLDVRGDVLEQLERSSREHDPERFAALSEQVFAHLGDASRVLRDVLYDRLGLPTPDREAPLLRPADPAPHRLEPASFEVFTEFTAPDAVVLRRYPAAVRRADDPADLDGGAQRHLAVDEDEPRLARHQSAAVLARGAVTDEADALAWLSRSGIDFPGARIRAAATADGCLATVRNGPAVRIATDRPAVAMLAASALYALVVAGRRAQQVTVVSGAQEFRMTVSER
ncbi:hypothetical protein [Saccharopolyspora sp. NPDC002578]